MSRRTITRTAAGLIAASALAASVPAVGPGPARGATRAPALPVRAPALTVRAAALYAPATGQTLAAIAPERELPIASTTKLMTALVVLEHVHDLSAVETFPDYDTAPGDSQIGLRPGERMTVRDLLVAMMLPSADDAAEDLAWNAGRGSVARFVAMMNAAARRLHLRHTHYATPIGLDTPGNHSSAHDLVRLAAYDLAHEPVLARIVRLRSARLSTGPVRSVTNLNDLLGARPWIDGVKTGHTSGAGYVLVASGHRHGMRLISAVLGTDSEAARDANSLALLEYGFDDFRQTTPVRRGEVLARVRVNHRGGRVPVRAARGFTRIVPRGEGVDVRLDVPRRLTGPLPEGAIVGSATVLAGGRPLGIVSVVLGRRLAAVSRLTLARRSLTRGWALGGLAGLAVLGFVGLAARARPAARLRPSRSPPRPRRRP